MIRIALLITAICISITAAARKVTIDATDRPAAEVFSEIMSQTGKNFVYSSDILKDVKVTVKAKNRPLKHVLSDMFRDTDITFKIRKNDVVLKRRKRRRRTMVEVLHGTPDIPLSKTDKNMLDEIIVVSRLEAPAVETAEVGAKKLTEKEIKNTPVLFGENDVIKALHLQPGVTEGSEGMAGMHVHGGGADENMYMLDNVPLYQINHFAGLFSAFNADAIRYIDFFKSSIPAKYDGRLSSFLDVRTKNGTTEGFRGSAKLGLTSGALNLEGPIGGKTSYSVALRRSWYDVLSVPLLALVNSQNGSEKINFHYYFTDLNAKINHRFTDRTSAYASIYFGNDRLKTANKDSDGDYEENVGLHWGNFVAQAGVNHRFTPAMTAEFTAAYTRFFSSLSNQETFIDRGIREYSEIKTKNNVNDWIARADFDWQAADNSRVRFGAGYTIHSFMPSTTQRTNSYADETIIVRDSTRTYHAGEINAYIEDDWKINDHWRANAGLHGSFFHIDGKNHFGISPRLSVSYRLDERWAFKGAFSRTTQYVHQLSQSYLALPTDQWIPITGKFKPQTANKVSVGAYWQSSDRKFEISAEAYYKDMRNLIDYCDEYYLRPPLEMWDTRLTSGKGSAKGIDFKLEKVAGRFTGHIAYSLAWADRTFKEKNRGHTYPARFDNRHTINILLNWNISSKVSLNAAWTGHSGNRFTFMPQDWEGPDFTGQYWIADTPLRTSINNYQLPFYHRLDLACSVANRRGYWTFSIYNAYCHKNVVAIARDSDKNSRPVFKKVSLLPIIPSVSYTWLF